MSALYISMAVMLLVGGAALAVYAALSPNDRGIEDRITDIVVKTRVSYSSGNYAAENDDHRARTLFRWIAQRLPQPKPDSPHAERVSHMLVHAGFLRSSSVRTFHLLRLASTVGGGLLGLFGASFLGASAPDTIIGLAVGVCLGSFIPSYYLSRKGRKRQVAIARQLSDVLDLLVVCVESGLGLSEAIKTVGAECERQKQEIGSELSIVSGEINSGNSLGQALRNFSERTAVADIKPLAATLIQSEQLGAQIAPALRSISESMRNTRRLRAEEAAQKTTVKILFPLVLLILPAMMSVIVGPAMIQLMHTLSE
jgi:tight adherence protein C